MDNNGSSLKEILILTLITVVSGMLLGFVYNITKEPIALSNERARTESEQAVFSEAGFFEVLSDTDSDAFTAAYQESLDNSGLTGVKLNSIDAAYKDESLGEKLGYVVDITDSDGYGGDIELMVGVTVKDGSYVINGISFLTLTETAGMGMKAKESPFIDSFSSLPADNMIRYTKTGSTSSEEIDAISGATITTSAVVNAVNAAVCAAKTYEEVMIP